MATFEGTLVCDDSLRFAIVVARFNDLVTNKLVESCQDCLKRHGIDINPEGTQVDYVWVPGSFEVPLVAKRLAYSGRYDAIICLGAVIRGDTPHFDYVSSEVAKGILTVDTLTQALERAGIKSNHGWGYALNAIEMATLMKQLPHIETTR
jgi:6,7-dimethyl-8-ribityllumazine synthase